MSSTFVILVEFFLISLYLMNNMLSFINTVIDDRNPTAAG